MIKIVGYDESVTKRSTCRRCGAIVEYTPDEIKDKLESDYGGGKDVVNYISCPGCRGDINVT